MAQSKASASAPIEALLREKRKFAPTKGFVKRALVNKASIYTQAARNPVRFWEGRARELHWFKPWKKALECYEAGHRKKTDGRPRDIQRKIEQLAP